MEEWVKYAVSILSGLATAIPLIVALVKYILYFLLIGNFQFSSRHDFFLLSDLCTQRSVYDYSIRPNVISFPFASYFFRFPVMDTISILHTAVRGRLRAADASNASIFSGQYFSQMVRSAASFSVSSVTGTAVPVITADSYSIVNPEGYGFTVPTQVRLTWGFCPNASVFCPDIAQ